MRKELWPSFVASAVIHVLLFMCFPDVEGKKEERGAQRQEYRVTRLPFLIYRKATPEPLPIAPHRREIEEETPPRPFTPQEEPQLVESLVRLKKEPSLCAFDSLRMYAVRDSIERHPVPVDSSELIHLRIKRNFEEMKKEIMAWQKGKGKVPGSRPQEVLADREEPRIGGGVACGFPMDWKGLKRAGRRVFLTGKGWVSKRGVEAFVEMSALEIDIMVVVWNLGRATPQDVHLKMIRKHRASYTDIARVMEELALRREILWELGGETYAPKVQRKEIMRFLAQEYIRMKAQDSSGTSELLTKIQRVLGS